MEHLDPHIRRFARRIRTLRAWTGFAAGGFLGGLVALMLASLDFFRVAYTEWLWLAVAAGAGAFVGALVAWILPVSAAAVAGSVDRRGGLQDRLATALERKSKNGEFDDDLRRDALEHVSKLDSRRAYPIRFGRWHAGFACTVALAAVVFLLGNSPLLLDKDAVKERAELQAMAERVERVARPVLERAERGELTAQERELAEQMKRFANELEKGRMTKQEALLKANELAKEAERLAAERYAKAEESLLGAETAFDKVTKQRLAEAGLENADPELLKMGDREFGAEEFRLDQQIADLERQLRDALGEAKEGDKDAERIAQDLAQQLQDAQKAKEAFELSKKAREFLQRLYAQKEFQELLELMREMRQSAKDAKTNPGDGPTKEQIEAWQKKLEELADRLKTEEDLKEFIEQLKKALKECENGQGMCFSCMGISICFGMQYGSPSIGKDDFFSDTGYVPQTSEEQQGSGQTQTTMVQGQRSEEGKETYIEVRGPAAVGDRSKTPYSNVIPQSQKAAEEAIKNKKIPKAHEKRVRDYFDSLQGGK